MVKLSEISKARDDDNPDQAYELWKQWHHERGIPGMAGTHRECYMRYIERLEAKIEQLYQRIDRRCRELYELRNPEMKHDRKRIFAEAIDEMMQKEAP